MRTITYKIIFLLVGLVSMLSATLPSQNKFKNLQILPKNISEDELDKVMDKFKLALGVDCNYCHAKNIADSDLDFPNDKKPEKEMARKMMTMTSDINKKYFDFNNKQNGLQAVNCITCHRNKPKPEIDSMAFPGKN